MENTTTQLITQEAAPDEEQLLHEAYSATAQEMAGGKSNAQLQLLLLDKGFNSEMADTIITDLRGQFKEVHREAACKDMLYGALWCGGGMLVTGFTYAMASEGGSYVMTWGAVIFGGFQFCKGLVNFIRN